MSLPHAILAILEIEDGTGYDLASRFKKSVGCFWSASHQQIYKELSRLTEAGWVIYRAAVQAGKQAKIYTLTDDGRAELIRWLGEPCRNGNYKDPFMVKVYASGNRQSEDLLQELAQQVIQHQQTLELYLALDAWIDRHEDGMRRKYRFPRATLAFGLKLERAWLEWAAELQSELASSD
jgi:PadR family transcriptional regulator AphA